jgi:N-terminal domain of toast_rack, DUF2154
MNHRIVFPVAILGLAVLACSANISLPAVATAGPEVTEDVTVPAPAAGPAALTISFGAGELKLSPGAAHLVDGTATYNYASLKPDVTRDGPRVEIRQGDQPTLPGSLNIKNEWDLKLGAQPMALTVKAGAYTGEFELGGLSLTSLTVKDGAATVDLAFSEPNPSSMTLFRYETGASKVKLTGLANANFGAMDFNSGAGDYTLDFGGTLRRAATVTVSSGLSNLIVVIPSGVPAQVTVESGASNISAGPGWTQAGNLYSQSGSGPALTMVIKTGAGNVTLTH